MTRTVVLKIAPLLLLAAGAGWAAHHRRVALEWIGDYLRPGQEEPVPLLRLQPRDYRVVVSAEGELAGLKTTTVTTPRVRTGALKIGWLAEEGKIVKKGEVLVRFDQTDAMIQLEQNQNSVLSYNQQIDKTTTDTGSEERILRMDGQGAELELTFARNQVRKDEDIFSQWEIQESVMSAALASFKKQTLREKIDLRQLLGEADLNILEIERRKAQTEVDLAEQTLSSLEARAPVAGVILYRRRRFDSVAVGDEVWPGQTLIDVADLRQFKGRLHVLETLIAGVENGKPVIVSIDALPGKTFSGTIDTVARAATQLGRQDPRKYFICEVILDVPLDVMEELRPGMRLLGEIETEQRRKAFVVPKSAVMRKEDGFIVFIREGDDYVEKPVTIVDSDHGFYVIGGPGAGDEICLRHPYEKQKLHLPDFNAPSSTTRGRRFVVML